jgi:hypothetical protein
MSNEVRTVTTIGHLALQETTRISTTDLKQGDIVRLKATKPVNEKPYGYAEVLALEEDQVARIRRFS